MQIGFTNKNPDCMLFTQLSALMISFPGEW